MYQKEWHGILFNSFAKVSSRKIADGAFYTKFYKEFFQKYSEIEDLDSEWVKLKRKSMEYIENNIDKQRYPARRK